MRRRSEEPQGQGTEQPALFKPSLSFKKHCLGEKNKGKLLIGAMGDQGRQRRIFFRSEDGLERARLLTFKTKTTLALLGTTPILGMDLGQRRVSGGPVSTPGHHNWVSSHVGPCGPVSPAGSESNRSVWGLKEWSCRIEVAERRCVLGGNIGQTLGQELVQPYGSPQLPTSS